MASNSMEVLIPGLLEHLNPENSDWQTEPLQTTSDEPQCPLCDNGWIVREVDGYRQSRKCQCLIAKEAERRIRISGLSLLLDKWTLDAYTATEEWQKRMKSTAEKYLDHVRNGGKSWLFMGGQVGCGKSHLCTAVCGEILKTRAVKYMQWVTDSRKLKALANDESFMDALEPYISADVLYIDDLFKMQHREGQKSRPTEADIRIAFELFNARYVRDKLTIISCEWLLTGDLMDADAGTFSRVYEKTRGFRCEILPGTGRNYRIREDA